MASYDESRTEYQRAMGIQLGNAYHSLWNECALIHTRWDEYVEMFGKSQAEFDVMNEVAPGFFKGVQDRSWESLLLHLCRFADPAKVAGRRTLSLDTLQNLSSGKVLGLTLLVAESRSKIKFAQDWRNRSIAHADFDYHLNKKAEPLVETSRLKIREALTSIAAVLEAVDHHFTGAGLYFGGISPHWGGNTLLSELRLLSRLRAERDQRINTGQATSDDLDWEKWR